ncbi:MAG: alkaline phosphatase, partial [Prochloraceae cyanobacterium]
LNTYRQRYALYKLDPDLQAAHAAFPFICTWDDHEVDNDYANYWSENFDSPEEFGRRRAVAYQAYYEHLPLRPVSFPQGSNLKLYRRFTFGDLAQFSILDTRQYRSNQACECSTRGGGQLLSKCSQLLDPRRTMLGAEQEQWLLSGLNSSPTIWNVVAQQYLVAQLKQNLSGRWTYWSDGWDGYPLSRQRILEFIYTRRIANPIFLGGDIHSFWVSELQTDFNNSNSPSVATEFVGTSISSRGVPYERFTAYLPDNTHIKFFESRWRGYVKCSVEREKWLAHLRIVETVNKPQAPLRTLASFVVHRGVPGVQRL